MSDDTKPSAAASEAAAPSISPAKDAPASTAADASKEDKAVEKPQAASDEDPSDKPAETTDVEMKGATKDSKTEAAAADNDSAPTESAATEKAKDAAAEVATPDKSKARRKSTGGAASAKKLNKKASKARITHIDAKPGDHFFVKLKGFPQWPAIICDEDMLPQALLTTRPVTAKREDGTYRDDYADGGKRAGDRSFPVMYLSTNEFGWVTNTDLIELDTETVLDVKMDKMRKDLQVAHRLASENHPIAYYKNVLQEFQEELLAKQKAKEAKAAGKKKKKVEEEAEDVEMADADEEAAEPKEKKSAKKRKAEENIETPQRSDSVKKPKIKLTTSSTPKANGASATPKASKAGSESKSSKPKTKKSKEPEEKKAEKEAATPKEPELTPEEKHLRKEKEVLFLRHKLQKGLLTRDQEPKEEEMNMMSEYIAKLESFPDLEVSIIRATKINKVLKAILKLEAIPRETEFKFKSRSQVLLDQWNKLLADGGAEATNGVNGASKDKEEAKTNGVKEHKEAAKAESKSEEAEAKPSDEKKEPEAVEAAA